MLSDAEKQIYQRQIMIPGFGEEGQEKLKRAKVLIAGAGGLGSPAALYLAAAGIGTLRIVDSDTVDLSNLNRQILHWSRDVGRFKVESAKEKLESLNPHINIEIIHDMITAENIKDMVLGCNAILDAVDNLETRYLLNQVAHEQRIALFHGAVSGFEGRAMTIVPGQSACLMCLYQGVSISAKTPVLGVTPGVVASIQATEVIKYLTGVGQLLINRFLIYDGLNMRFSEIEVARDPSCKHCGKIP